MRAAKHEEPAAPASARSKMYKKIARARDDRQKYHFSPAFFSPSSFPGRFLDQAARDCRWADDDASLHAAACARAAPPTCLLDAAAQTKAAVADIEERRYHFRQRRREAARAARRRRADSLLDSATADECAVSLGACCQPATVTCTARAHMTTYEVVARHMMTAKGIVSAGLPPPSTII